MPIEFHCPHCEKFLRTGDDKAGRSAMCPGCGEHITVPSDVVGEFRSADEFDYGGDDAYGPAEGEEIPSLDMKRCPMCGEQIKAAAIRCRYCGEELEVGDVPVEHVGGRNLEYAGFWMRFVAYIVDSFVIMAIMFPLLCLIGGLVAAASMGPNGRQLDPVALEQGSAVAEMIWNIVLVVILWLYFAFMESSSKQATLGKMALGLVVTDMRGERISFGKATGRFFGKFLSGFICSIGYIMAGFTEQKQALHDIMASCLIVRK